MFFLLDRIDFLALVGLFAQAALTWVFVAVLATLRWEEGRRSPLDSWTAAFTALAIGLTLMSVRFFYAFGGGLKPAVEWDDGQPRVTLCYSIYMLSKAAFGYLLLRGALDLAGRHAPAALRSVAIAIVVVLAATPWFADSINTLLIIQAPVLIVYLLAAWRVLRPRDVPGNTGIRLVRIALLATAGAWVLHGAGAIVHESGARDLWNTLLAMNSFIDAALELVLGVGLIVAVLQDTHHSLQEAQAEQARLRSEMEHDERLRALGTLVSGVAHELNNPLTAIVGFAEVLDDPVGGAEAAQIVREQAERCRGIVRSLSALSGVRTDRRESVDLHALLSRVIRGFSTQLHGVRIEKWFEEVPHVSADRVGVEQIVVNLISNAIYVTPSGGRIVVRLRSDAEHAVVEVVDEGPGVPEEQRTRLFEPFYTTKTAGSGVGLGLAVSFAIASSHNGTLSVGDGDGGRGACLTLRLPLPGDVVREVRPVGVIDRSGHGPFDTATLLIIDDEPMVRTVVRRHVEPLGIVVLESSCAEEALELLEQRSVDAVLCDLRMPGMGGVGFYRELRHRRPELAKRCLFITGDLASEEAVALLESSPPRLIPKPFDFPELVRRIKGTLRSGAA